MSSFKSFNWYQYIHSFSIIRSSNIRQYLSNFIFNILIWEVNHHWHASQNSQSFSWKTLQKPFVFFCILTYSFKELITTSFHSMIIELLKVIICSLMGVYNRRKFYKVFFGDKELVRKLLFCHNFSFLKSSFLFGIQLLLRNLNQWLLNI